MTHHYVGNLEDSGEDKGKLFILSLSTHGSENILLFNTSALYIFI